MTQFIKTIFISTVLVFSINPSAFSSELVNGGGIGGNLKMGMLFYDGMPNHLQYYPVTRNADLNICYLQNADVKIIDSRTHNTVAFACQRPLPKTDNVYFNATNENSNGGFSPDNDAIYGITFIKQMYLDWYGIPPIVENGKSVMVTVQTHINMDNASWEGKIKDEWRINLGDGGTVKYPSTAIGVIAHEIGHGFTEQHSNLIYAGQSGGLNESFSDMADQAAQYYAYNGNNNWLHDAEITKEQGKALRYLDKPSRDCYGYKKPGVNCSIDDMSQYRESTDVHYSSGIFNHVFYLIGTAKEWDARKAFNVMEKANTDYWTAGTSFNEAACGVISAAKDYEYDLKAIYVAFAQVGVETSHC